MATVYIIYSEDIDRYYIGSCANLEIRLEQHNSGIYKTSFTKRANDWVVFFAIDNLKVDQSRQIENHIKNMKSRTYIENLAKFQEMSEKLIELYTQ